MVTWTAQLWNAAGLIHNFTWGICRPWNVAWSNSVTLLRVKAPAGVMEKSRDMFHVMQMSLVWKVFLNVSYRWYHQRLTFPRFQWTNPSFLIRVVKPWSGSSGGSTQKSKSWRPRRAGPCGSPWRPPSPRNDTRPMSRHYCVRRSAPAEPASL